VILGWVVLEMVLGMVLGLHVKSGKGVRNVRRVWSLLVLDKTLLDS
jgi:hypothetical protein